MTLLTMPEILSKKKKVIFKVLIFGCMGQHECHFIKLMMYSLRHSELMLCEANMLLLKLFSNPD